MNGVVRLNKIEKILVAKWLEKILFIDFEGKKIIQEQLKSVSAMTISKCYSHVFVEFHFEGDVSILSNRRLHSPIQMSANQQYIPPIFFVLMARNGIVFELEVGTVDASELDIFNIDLSDVEYHIER